MRGHEIIIEYRMAGYVPEWVFINDYPCKTDWYEWGDTPTVCTHGDAIHNLDLRFLVGLKVSVTSESESRVKELFQRIKSAGAKLVGAGHIQAGVHCSQQTGWVEIFEKEVA